MKISYRKWKVGKKSFCWDVLILMVVSIFIGSLLAGTLSFSANAYFSKTLSNLVGDYGQYDVIIQVREELKQDAEEQINKVIADAFPGAVMKEGPTITGKTSIFISLPEQFKTKQVYDDLSKTFGSIPGGAAVGVMTDPRLTIRGVPDGAKNMVMDKISQLDGVRFAFHDGASIGVVLTSFNKSAAVSEQIKNLLKHYQVIEISFPVGSEPSNPIRLGDTIANDMQNQLKLEYARNVSIGGKNDDMTYMVGTMMELKRFLADYATQVTLKPAGGTKFVPDEVLVFQGTAPQAPQAGSPVNKANVLVKITDVHADGTAAGLIIQGDASALTNLQGYKVNNSVIDAAVATASYRNPRQQLGNALNETAKVVGQIPGFVQDAQNMGQVALGALNNYDTSVAAIRSTLDGVRDAGNSIQSATSGLTNMNTGGMQAQLANSSKALSSLITTLKVVKMLQPDVANTIDGLNGTRQNLDNLKAGLSALDNVAADARQAKATVDNIVVTGNNALNTLQAFDVNGARTSLQNANKHLAELQQMNLPLITAQLQYLSTAVPNLKDEDISHSMALLDKFIGGQVIPGARIQILTTNNISTDAVMPIVTHDAGYNNVSLYSTSLGVIEPNPRSEMYEVLNQVKAILAGLTSLVMTILFLALDHTSIMAVIRRRRLSGTVKAKGWRKVLKQVTAIFSAPERQYGMVVGAILLTAMFILSGGGIPYLPWIGVPVIGAFLGSIMAGYADKINPVAGDEVMAGQALGMSFDDIMREIVIPNGRPGVMQKLNKRKLQFK